MKKLITPILIVLSAFFAVNFSACTEGGGDPGGEKFTVSPLELTFTSEGGEEPVSVTGTGWIAVPSADWIEVTETEGGFTVFVDVAYEARSGSVTVAKNASETKIVAVTQDAPTEIKTSPGSLGFLAAGGVKTVTVNSRLEWTPKAIEDWIEITAIDDDKFTVSVGVNEGIWPRAGSVEVSNGTETITVPVTQEQDKTYMSVVFDHAILEYRGSYEGGFGWTAKFHTSGVYANGYGELVGTGYLVQTQITSAATGDGSSLPDGTYNIEESTDVGTALAGYATPESAAAGTWIFELQEGLYVQGFALLSGTFTTHYTGGEYSIEMTAKDKDGKDFVAIFEGEAEYFDLSEAE